MTDRIISRPTSYELKSGKPDTVHIMRPVRSVTVTNHATRGTLRVGVNAVPKGALDGPRKPHKPAARGSDGVSVPPGRSIQVFTSQLEEWVTLVIVGAGDYTVDPSSSTVVGVQSNADRRDTPTTIDEIHFDEIVESDGVAVEHDEDPPDEPDLTTTEAERDVKSGSEDPPDPADAIEPPKKKAAARKRTAKKAPAKKAAAKKAPAKKAPAKKAAARVAAGAAAKVR